MVSIKKLNKSRLKDSLQHSKSMFLEGWVDEWMDVKAILRIFTAIKKAEKVCSWKDGWKDGWMDVISVLRIAYSNQKYVQGQTINRRIKRYTSGLNV